MMFILINLGHSIMCVCPLVPLRTCSGGVLMYVKESTSQVQWKKLRHPIRRFPEVSIKEEFLTIGVLKSDIVY